MSSTADSTKVRLQATSDPVVGLRQLHDMFVRGEVTRAVVCADYRDGAGHVLGLNADPQKMARLLIMGVKCLEHVADETPAARTMKIPPIPSATKLNTIAHEWAALEQSAFDGETMPVQRSESRKMFYSGASALFFMMMKSLKGSLDEETPQEMDLMEGWFDELKRFGEEVR